MHRPRTVLLALLAALAPLASEPFELSAQSITSPYRFITTKQGFDVRLGFGSFGSEPLGIAPGSGPVVGVYYGLDLGGPWAFDLGGAMHLSERDVIDPTREEGNRVIGTTAARLSEFGVRLRFGLTGDRTFHGVNPFFIAGVGVGLDLAGAAPEESELDPGDVYNFSTTFVPTFGVGARMYPTDRWELRGEVGMQLWSIDTPPGFQREDRFGPNIGSSQDTALYYLTFGLAYRF